MEDRQRRNNIYITGVGERGKTKQWSRITVNQVKWYLKNHIKDISQQKYQPSMMKKSSRSPGKKIKHLRKAKPLAQHQTSKTAYKQGTVKPHIQTTQQQQQKYMDQEFYIQQRWAFSTKSTVKALNIREHRGFLINDSFFYMSRQNRNSVTQKWKKTECQWNKLIGLMAENFIEKCSDRGMQNKTTMTHCFSTIALVEIKKQDNSLLVRLGKR